MTTDCGMSKAGILNVLLAAFIVWGLVSVQADAMKYMVTGSINTTCFQTVLQDALACFQHVCVGMPAVFETNTKALQPSQLVLQMLCSCTTDMFPNFTRYIHKHHQGTGLYQLNCCAPHCVLLPTSLVQQYECECIANLVEVW